eukprot:11161041-Lingulodinium_polyedra.AAC.1
MKKLLLQRKEVGVRECRARCLCSSAVLSRAARAAGMKQNINKQEVVMEVGSSKVRKQLTA